MKVTAAAPSLLMLVFVCGAVAAGCAGTSRIVLPAFDVEIATPNVRRTTTDPPTIHVARFERPTMGQDPERIGSARSGMSGRRASVRISEHPGDLIARTIAAALTDAGIELASSDDARVVLTGSIARFDVEERSEGSTFEVAAADVRFSAELAATENGVPRTVLSGEYTGQAVSHPALDATQEQRYMLADAISEAIGSLLNEPELWRALGMTPR